MDGKNFHTRKTREEVQNDELRRTLQRNEVQPVYDLKLSRHSTYSFECEIARQRYKFLYDQVECCGLEEDYEAWAWQEEEED